MAFHEGNRTQSVFAPRATAYFVGALTGRVAPTSFTINLPRQFRLFSPVIVGVPQGLPGGHTISAQILPAIGPQAKGNPLRLQVELGGTLTVSQGDLLVTQC